MWVYRSLFAFDTLVLLVLAYFFLDGLQYVVSGDYVAIWLPLLGVPIAGLIGAWVLQEKGKRGWAIAVLAVLALPPALMGLFFGMLLMTNPSWQ
jgi:hypothetical protein